MAVRIIDPSNPLPPTYGELEDALLLGIGETVILKAGAEIAAYGENSSAISGLWDNTLLIDGHVHSERSSAVVIQGIVNVGTTGSITGAADGVYLYGENEPGKPNILINAGLVSGGFYGTRLEASENLVTNSGKIVGQIGIAAGGSDKKLVINNTGLIKGTDGTAIYGAVSGPSVVTNSGHIEGDVILGGNAWLEPAGPPTHVYDGRGGTIAGIVYFAAGNDIAYGGNGSETFVLGVNTNFVDGGGGIDTLIYNFKATVDLRITSKQQTSTNAWDTIQNIENLNGGIFADCFIGNASENTLVGNGGNDTLDGYDGNDLLSGGAGDDLLVGGSGSDMAVFTGKFTDYTITVVAGGGIKITDNRVSGDGTDYLGGVEFALFSDRIYTLPPVPPVGPVTPVVKNLTFKGGSKADTFVGGKGHDYFYGGLGNDKLTGGDGYDVFAFTTKLSKGNVDTVIGFHSPDDTIQLSKAIFGKIAKGLLNESAFHVGKKAHDKSDRIIFHEDTGALYYDADGAGTKHGAVKFAQLKANTLLKADDFFIA